MADEDYEGFWNARIGIAARWVLIVPAALVASWVVGFVVKFVTGPSLLAILPGDFSGAEWPNYVRDFLVFVAAPRAFVLAGAYVAPSLRRTVAIILAVVWPPWVAVKILDQGTSTFAWVCLAVSVISGVIAVFECFEKFGPPKPVITSANAWEHYAETPPT